jgi:major vault protein
MNEYHDIPSTSTIVLTIIASNAKSEAERILKEREAADARATNALAAEKAQAEQSAVQLEVQRLADAQKLEQARANQAIELEKLNAQVEGLVKKAAAVSPDLVAALQAYGDKAMIEKVSEAMAPLSILGGGSVVDVLKKLLDGTALAKQLEPVTNGTTAQPTRGRATSHS